MKIKMRIYENDVEIILKIVFIYTFRDIDLGIIKMWIVFVYVSKNIYQVIES